MAESVLGAPLMELMELFMLEGVWPGWAVGMADAGPGARILSFSCTAAP